MITGTQHNTTQQPNRPCHLNRTAQAYRTISRPQQPPMQPWLATESHIDTHLRLHATKRQRVSWPKKLKRRWTHAESTRPQNPHRPPVTCAAPCPRSLVTRNSDHIVDRTLPVVDPPCCLAGDPFFRFAFAPKYLFLLSTRPLVPILALQSSTTPSKDTKPTSFLLLKTRPIPPL
ncbi:hypothetical protein J3E69DRAFT_350833 [Trichoderma sp. SZMC 28015]